MKTARTYYFSLGDTEKWTVHIGKDKCKVERGQANEDADCFFKASERCSSTSGAASTARPPRTS